MVHLFQFSIFLLVTIRVREDELVLTELVGGSVFEVLHAPEASNWTLWPAMLKTARLSGTPLDPPAPRALPTQPVDERTTAPYADIPLQNTKDTLREALTPAPAWGRRGS